MVIHHPNGTTEFRFFRPRAKSVSLAGDFNNWHPDSFRMTPQPHGWWQCRFTLAPGLYEFLYHADGQWYPDYAAFGLEPGPYGWNSVVRVDQSAPALRDRASIALPKRVPPVKLAIGTCVCATSAVA